MEQNESVISGISPNEIDESQYRQMSIRFDCLVKMFDSGTRMTKASFPFQSKPLPPQWFKSEIKLTMEAVEYYDPYKLGMIIKNAFSDLKRHIEQYEKPTS